MAVADNAPTQTVSAGTGAATPIAISWRFLDADHLVVTEIVAGVEDETPLVRGSDYSVAGGGAGGGTVTPLAAIAVGTSWRIRRETPIGQPSVLSATEYKPPQQELGMDRQALVLQEQDRELDRTLKGPRGEVLPAIASLVGIADGDLLAYDAATNTFVIYTSNNFLAELQAVAAAAGAITGVGEFANTAAGLAGTAVGDTFWVDNLNGTATSYLHETGPVATELTVFILDIIAAGAAALIGATGGTVQGALDGKAAASHTHSIANVTSLQAALDAKAELVSPAMTGAPTSGGIEIGFRSIPRSTTTTTAAIDDRGKCIAITAGLTIPNAVFAAGDAISIYNNSAGALTITQGASLTLRLVGTDTTGNRTLAARGWATVWFNTASEAVISGGGLT